MATTHHFRHSSTHIKRTSPTHTRSSKSTPQFRRTSSHGCPKKSIQKSEDTEDEESMATSFLNFCTTCEKQIIIPSNLVLYCSESCRRKDTEKQLSFPFDYSPPPTPFGTFIDMDSHFRDIVPARSPTQLSSKRNSVAFSDLSDENMAASDSTEPKHESEASRYLRHFQTSSYSAESTSTARPNRPRVNRTSSSQVTYAPTPSLSHTPTSSISYSLPYTPAATRPLPPRNTSSYGARSIDLVTPWAYPGTAPLTPPKYSMKSRPTCEGTSREIEGEIRYDKSPIPEMSMANGSLGRLLGAITN